MDSEANPRSAKQTANRRKAISATGRVFIWSAVMAVANEMVHSVRPPET